MARQIVSTDRYRLALLQSMQNWDAAIARQGGGRVESQAFGGSGPYCAYAMSMIMAGAVGVLDPSRELDYDALLGRDRQAFREAARTRNANATLAVGAFDGRVRAYSERAREIGAFHRGHDGYVPHPGDMLSTDGPGHINMITEVVELEPGRWEVHFRDNPTMYGTNREKRAILRTSEDGRGFIVERSDVYNSVTGERIGPTRINPPLTGGRINIIDMQTFMERSRARDLGRNTTVAATVEDQSEIPVTRITVIGQRTIPEPPMLVADTTIRPELPSRPVRTEPVTVAPAAVATAAHPSPAGTDAEATLLLGRLSVMAARGELGRLLTNAGITYEPNNTESMISMAFANRSRLELGGPAPTTTV